MKTVLDIISLFIVSGLGVILVHVIANHFSVEEESSDRKDFPRSIFFKEDDKIKFFFAYNLMSFLNRLDDENLSNHEMMMAIEEWMSEFQDTSIEFYILSLLKGQSSLPRDDYFKDLSSKDLEILKDRSKVNDLLRYIVETNLNIKD